MKRGKPYALSGKPSHNILASLHCALPKYESKLFNDNVHILLFSPHSKTSIALGGRPAGILIFRILNDHMASGSILSSFQSTIRSGTFQLAIFLKEIN
jgi:hypothetical protein